MSEIMARINAEHLVELIDDRSASIASVPPMTPQDTGNQTSFKVSGHFFRLHQPLLGAAEIG
jgi:hypothetical protein